MIRAIDKTDDPTRCPGYGRVCHYAKDGQEELCPHCAARAAADNWIRQQRERDRIEYKRRNLGPIPPRSHYVALLQYGKIERTV